MQTGDQRRSALLEILKKQTAAISATQLARKFKVSRQIIVGDIALLRALGHDIVASARGYTLDNRFTDHYVGTIAAFHDSSQTLHELRAIVDGGGTIIDVTVEHPIYGELTGQLNIATTQDIEYFMDALETNNAVLLSSLTNGVHLHTIACKDEDMFLAIKQTLDAMGYLFNGT